VGYLGVLGKSALVGLGARKYLQPLCKSVHDSDFEVRHFSIGNRSGASKKAPREDFPSDQWHPESMKNKINDLSSFIYFSLF
jgi:hypothetical protein